MLAGFDRYMQIARCFRDEDLRADRQPEFTQIDLEMSFIDEEDIMAVAEGFVKTVYKEVLDVEIQTPFPRMTYAEGMERFGSDKPDLRFGYGAEKPDGSPEGLPSSGYLPGLFPPAAACAASMSRAEPATPEKRSISWPNGSRLTAPRAWPGLS